MNVKFISRVGRRNFAYRASVGTGSAQSGYFAFLFEPHFKGVYVSVLRLSLNFFAVAGQLYAARAVGVYLYRSISARAVFKASGWA